MKAHEKLEATVDQLLEIRLKVLATKVTKKITCGEIQAIVDLKEAVESLLGTVILKEMQIAQVLK